MDVVRIPLLRRSGHVAGHAIVDRIDADSVSRHVWRLNSEGYARRRADGGDHLYMQWAILALQSGPPDGYEVDHLNGVRLDNRRANLRLIPKRGNRQNRASWSNSGERGVSWVAARRKWQATVWLDGKCAFFRRYDSREEAAQAVREFRETNVPYYVVRPADPASEATWTK